MNHPSPEILGLRQFSNDDEDRKIPLSPPVTNPSPSIPILARPDPVFGPDRPLGPHLTNLLAEWHQKHRFEVPPFASGKYNCKSKWKVFDRNGAELQLARFTVSRPLPYYMMVLYPTDGSEKFVACVGKQSKYGTYLVEWLGTEPGYATESCAIRVFGPQPEDIKFSPEIWQNAPADITPVRHKLKSSLAQSDLPQTTPQRKPQRLNDKVHNNFTPVNNFRAVNNSPANYHQTNNHTINNRLATAPESEDTDSSGSYESSDSESSAGGDIPFSGLPATKKRKVDEEASIPTKGREVVFKLICDNSDATRAFTVNKSCPGRELFAKARQFYRLLAPKAEVNILVCRIPSKSEQRYLYDGDDGEVSYFIREMRNLTHISGDTALIEVKYVV